MSFSIINTVPRTTLHYKKSVKLFTRASGIIYHFNNAVKTYVVLTIGISRQSSMLHQINYVV